MEISLLTDIALIIIVASIFAGLVKLFKQPLILGYVLGGITIGPAVLGLVHNQDLVTTLSEIGIALLLFFIGLELDIKKLKEVGLTAGFIGCLHVITSSGIGFLAGYLLGFEILECVFIGLIISFSTTMIVVKILSDKNELDSLHGKMMVGILITEDILAVLAMAFVTSINKITPSLFGLVILKGIGLLVISYIIIKYALPKVFKFFESSPELLFMGSLAVCAVLSGVAYALGYSLAIGAFIAGVALTTTQYNLEIASKVRPLRDFFAVLFFVTLGMAVVFKGLFELLIPFFVLLLITVIIKPIVIFTYMKLFGFGRRTAVLTGAGLGNTSEFALILVSVAVGAGILSQSVIILTTLLMVATATI
ncbi:MAG: cation:proton antiporter, partial [Nanoarchaeota archaeon]|nr:cation:proton antiporter [Nanoarchaeota archaeon]